MLKFDRKNWATDKQVRVKDRSPPPNSSLPWHVLDAINEFLKEKNPYNMT